jgi:hypothetical protein
VYKNISIVILIMVILTSYIFALSYLVRLRVNQLEDEMIKMEQGVDRLEQTVLDSEKALKELIDKIDNQNNDLDNKLE